MSALDRSKGADRPRTYSGPISRDQLEHDATKYYPESFAVFKSEITRQDTEANAWIHVRLKPTDAVSHALAHDAGPVHFHMIGHFPSQKQTRDRLFVYMDKDGNVCLSLSKHEDDTLSYTKQSPDVLLDGKSLKVYKIWSVIMQQDKKNGNNELLEAAAEYILLINGLKDQYSRGNDFQKLCNHVSENLPTDPDTQKLQKKPSDEGSESQMRRTMQNDDDANGGATSALHDGCRKQEMQLREENQRLAERIKELECRVETLKGERGQVDNVMRTLANNMQVQINTMQALVDRNHL